MKIAIFKEDLDYPTEQETLDRAQLVDDAKNGDLAAAAQLRKEEEDRRQNIKSGIYREGRRTRADGTKETFLVLESYYRVRAQRKNDVRMYALLAAMIGAGIFIISAIMFKSYESAKGWIEILANGFIVLGTYFTAKGVILGRGVRRWFEELVAQHSLAVNEQIPARKSEITRQLRKVLLGLEKDISAGMPVAGALDKQAKELLKVLQKETSGFHRIAMLTQRDIATALLDASSAAKLGGLFVIAGTLILAWLSLHSH